MFIGNACRYIARPPLSLERLEEHLDGPVRIRFKSAWKDGTHSIILDPLDFVSRLCALIPPPVRQLELDFAAA